MESRSSDSGTPRFSPFVQPALRDRAKFIPESGADPPADDDLPLIEQFRDELPSIEDYVEEGLLQAEVVPAAAVVPAERDAEGWAISGWQSYDWNSLAQLGPAASDSTMPEETWNAEPWPASVTADPGPSADEVAAALDHIAQRIRSGDVPIDQFRSSPPEAAMAAVIAAMLRLRG